MLWQSNVLWFGRLLLFVFLVNGCGMREVRFTIQEPSRISLAPVRTLAVLDFGTPYAEKRFGEEFAARVQGVFQEQASPHMVSPSLARSALSEMRITASQFDDPAVVLTAGKRLAADALLYGDIQQADTRRWVEREKISHKVGERRERVKEIAPDGNVRNVEYVFPIYEERWHDHIHRSFRFHAVARMVRVTDNSILWQGEVNWTQTSSAEEDQDGTRRGDWTSDHEFEIKQLTHAAHKMLLDVLPRSFSRIRVLAVPEQEGPYAEWIKLGNDAALAGDWNQAGSHWLNASLLNASLPEARGNLGILRERAGDTKQALLDYDYAASKKSKPWSEYARQVRRVLEQR